MKNLGSQSGSAMLNALILVGVVGGISSYIITEAGNTNKNSKIPRIKSQMSAVESKIRTLALQPETYSNCWSSNENVSQREDAQKSHCSVNPDPFLRTVGKVCNSNNKECKIEVDQSSIRFDGSKLTAKVNYVGTDVSIKPVDIAIEIPPEIARTKPLTCTQSSPFFVGLDTRGLPICKNIPPKCPTGQYLKRFDNKNMSFECVSISTTVACNSSQYMSSFSWTGTDANKNPIFNKVCNNKVDPFAYYNFSPQVSTSGPIGNGNANPVNPPQPDDLVSRAPANSTTTTTTSTSTTTTTTPSSECYPDQASCVAAWGSCAATPTGNSSLVWTEKGQWVNTIDDKGRPSLSCGGAPVDASPCFADLASKGVINGSSCSSEGQNGGTCFECHTGTYDLLKTSLICTRINEYKYCKGSAQNNNYSEDIGSCSEQCSSYSPGESFLCKNVCIRCNGSGQISTVNVKQCMK